MNRITLYRTLLVFSCFISLAVASDPVVISDGPTKATAHPRIITTDGPAHPAYVYPPPIIISNGPAHLAYTYASPGKVEMTDGPSSAASPKVVIIDGPEPIHRIKHVSKKAMVKTKPPLPEPETSALAPAIPTANPSSDVSWGARAVVGTLFLFLIAGTLVWMRRKRAF